jgi:hypothetical protein
MSPLRRLSRLLSFWPGRSGNTTPSMASRPSPPIHGRSFGRFDEITHLVENASALTLARRVSRASPTRLPDSRLESLESVATFCHSQSWQTPLVACDEPCFSRLGNTCPSRFLTHVAIHARLSRTCRFKRARASPTDTFLAAFAAEPLSGVRPLVRRKSTGGSCLRFPRL